MTIKRNPKQSGTDYWDCIVQKGPCPMNCNQCFYNRPGAFYVPFNELPLLPDPEEVDNGLVRMNCGHDSNIEFEKVIKQAAKYKNAFFNTSIPIIEHFPGPVVFTANKCEEELATLLAPAPANLMFIRLRVSATNLPLIDMAVEHYEALQIPIVLTFMAYYDKEPQVPFAMRRNIELCYKRKKRHINSYWCPTKEFMQYVMARYHNRRIVSMCSSMDDYYCRACRNCETYYIQTQKRLRNE